MSTFDFSNLPDVVWANVMSYLNLQDRLSLARTCARLYDVFNHPSVWQTVRIVLLKDLPGPGSPSAEQYESMIDRFGTYFHDLTLIIHGDVCRMGGLGEPCQKVLNLMAENCRPIKFSVYVGNGRVAPVKPKYEDFAAIKSVISKSSRLRSLNIASWPLHHSSFSEGRSDVLDKLIAGDDQDTIYRLEHLKLFSSSPKCGEWVPLNSCLPSPDQLAETLKKFTRLRSIGLNSHMLNEAVLAALSLPGRSPSLKHIELLVQYSTGRFPRIAAFVWKALCVSNAEVFVDITVSNTTPHLEMISLLQPEVPLRSITFSKYTRYDADVLIYLSSNHRTALRIFHDYNPERMFENEILEMVSQCSSLDTLVFRGSLSRHAIITLASLRGSRWKRLEVSFKLYSNRDFGDDVLAQTTNGQYVIVDHLPGSQFFHTDESDKQLVESIKELSVEVSNIICQKWRPSNIDTLIASGLLDISL